MEGHMKRKSKISNVANGVTLLRIALLFLLVVLVYSRSIWARLGAAFLATIVIVMDWLDGFLARKLNISTMLGSVLDITGDRIVENVLWIVLSDLKLIPVWIPIVVVSRGIMTDSVRNYALKYGKTAFGATTMMRTKLGKFLTGSPIMRTSYAVMKGVTFTLLILVTVLDQFWKFIGHPELTTLTPKFHLAGLILAVLTAIMCLVRGIPVIIEGFYFIREMEEKEV